MARTPEGKVKDAVKKVLVEHNIWYYMPVSNGMGQHGIPDFVCCVPGGRFLGIETKAPGRLGTVSALQERVIEQIRSRKGWIIVVDDAESVRQFLQENGIV